MTPLGEAERVNDVVLFALGMGFKTKSSPKYCQNPPAAMSHSRRPDEDDIPQLVAIIIAFH